MIRTADFPSSMYQEVLEELMVPGPVRWMVTNSAYEVPEEVASWERLFGVCNKFRSDSETLPDDQIVLITTRNNDRNWFSASQLGVANNSFISTAHWESYFGFPMKYAVAYLSVANVLRRYMFREENDLLASSHEPPIGCLNDMTAWKPDIHIKLRTADICQDCYEKLLENQANEEAVYQLIEILENLRKKMLLRSPYLQDTPVVSGEDLPFTVAITRRRMHGSVEPLRRFLFLLDHFDSIVRTAVLIIGKIILRDEYDDFLVEQRLTVRPALGDWVSSLDRLARRIPEIGLRIEDSALLFESVRKVHWIASQTRFVNLRNEHRGHGYIRLTDAGYMDLFLEYSVIMEKIERLIFPLLRRTGCYLVLSSTRREDGIFDIDCFSLMGPHPDFIQKSIPINARGIEDIPIRGRVYATMDGRWYDLHDRLLFVVCPECEQERVLIMDGSMYLDPYAGHRVSVRPGN